VTARHRRILVAVTLVGLFAAVPAGAEEPGSGTAAPEPGPSLAAPELLDVVSDTLHVAVVGAGERPLEAVVWKGPDMVTPPHPLEESLDDEGGRLWRVSIDVSRVRNGLALVEVRDRGPVPEAPTTLRRHVVLSSPAPTPQVSATVDPSGTATVSWEGIGDVVLSGARIDGRDGPVALLDPGQLRTAGSHALDGLEPGEHRLRVVAERLGGYAEMLETASDEVLVTVPAPPEAETETAEFTPGEPTPGEPGAPGGVRAAQGGPPERLDGGGPDQRHRDVAQREGDDGPRRSNRPGLRSATEDLADDGPLPQVAPPLAAPSDTEEEATAAAPDPLAAPPSPLATDPLPPPGPEGGDAVRLLGLLAAAGLVTRRLRTLARLR
jgi:hypothetical protein